MLNDYYVWSFKFILYKYSVKSYRNVIFFLLEKILWEKLWVNYEGYKKCAYI